MKQQNHPAFKTLLTVLVFLVLNTHSLDLIIHIPFNIIFMITTAA